MAATKKAPTKRKAAKKTTAKKATKKTAKTTNGDAMLKVAKQVLPKLQAGKTTLSAERDRLGMKSNGPLRKALTSLLGSKKAYTKMMAAHNGRTFRKGSKPAAKGK